MAGVAQREQPIAVYANGAIKFYTGGIVWCAECGSCPGNAHYPGCTILAKYGCENCGAFDHADCSEDEDEDDDLRLIRPEHEGMVANLSAYLAEQALENGEPLVLGGGG